LPSTASWAKPPSRFFDDKKKPALEKDETQFFLCFLLMKPPIFVWAPNDLLVFPSPKAAENYLEAVDVENGVYTAAFDSQELQLKIQAKEPTKRGLGLVWGGRVTVEPAEGKPTHMVELETILRKFIQATGKHSEEWLRSAPTEQLLKVAAEMGKTR
jgi:hypothetical protein